MNDEYTFYTEAEFDEAIAEYEAEYTAQLETISTLKSTLIRIQAVAKTADRYPNEGILLIRKLADLALEITAEPLVPDEVEEATA